MTNWQRFQEVDFDTEPEEGLVDVRIGGKMREALVLAQTDTHPSVFGYPSRQGDLIVMDAGYLYQSQTDWHDQITDACEHYGAEEVPDFYAQCKTFRLPSVGEARRAFIRAIKRIDDGCAQEYTRRREAANV